VNSVKQSPMLILVIIGVAILLLLFKIRNKIWKYEDSDYHNVMSVRTVVVLVVELYYCFCCS